jgi:hypothetical protein
MIKCLTLHQPWATLMALAGHPDPEIRKLGKLIETRSWPTSYRGLLAITASKQWDDDEVYWVMKTDAPAAKVIRETLGAAGFRTLRDLPLGAVLCVGTLVNCIRFNSGWRPDPPEWYYGNYAVGRYGFVMQGMKALPEPMPIRGMQGLWNPPYDVAEQLEQFYREAA